MKRKTNRGERRQYYAVGSHPAIISKEIFEAVQEERMLATEEQQQLQVALDRIRMFKENLSKVRSEIARIESDIEIGTRKLENRDMDDREAADIHNRLASEKARLNELMKEKMRLEWELAEAEQDEEDLNFLQLPQRCWV